MGTGRHDGEAARLKSRGNKGKNSKRVFIDKVSVINGDNHRPIVAPITEPPLHHRSNGKRRTRARRQVEVLRQCRPAAERGTGNESAGEEPMNTRVRNPMVGSCPAQRNDGPTGLVKSTSDFAQDGGLAMTGVADDRGNDPSAGRFGTGDQAGDRCRQSCSLDVANEGLFRFQHSNTPSAFAHPSLIGGTTP